MIEIKSGDLLAADAEALVNTVNTVGIMGKGIALRFKEAYPQMFKAYVKACKDGDVQIGRMFVYDLGGLLEGPRWVINFPTKGHWRSNSRMADIHAGLHDLVTVVRQLDIRSIAIPALGCGNGGLDWCEVRPHIEAALSRLSNVHIMLFPPPGTSLAQSLTQPSAQAIVD